MTVIEATEHQVLVLKPAAVPCELPFNKEADSVLRRLVLQGIDGVRLVHRLDAPTSGLLLIARTADAATYYSQEIAARRWHKWYVARVDAPLERAVRLCGAHKAYLKTDGRQARVVRSGGKPSFLEVTAAVPAPTGHGTDLLIRLHTGRFHQIRAMLGHLGSPLIGDRKYGSDGIDSIYLEHVMLAARPYAATEWRVWTAPEHPDRPKWAAGLVLALEEQRDALIATLQEPVR